jgi:RecA-family ATPase
MRTVRAIDVEPEAVDWLWYPRVPLGKLTLLAGDPGGGKSQISIAIAAAVTKGVPLPGDTAFVDPANVLIISAEDGIADTIRPRLEAAGADLTRAHILECLEKSGQPIHLALEDPEHLLAVELAIEELDPALVVLDPASAYLGKIDSHKDAAVRGVVAPLAGLAERYHAAVLGIIHLSKSNNTVKALYRVLGSIAFTAAPRSVLLAGSEPEAEDHHALDPPQVQPRPPGRIRGVSDSRPNDQKQ